MVIRPRYGDTMVDPCSNAARRRRGPEARAAAQRRHPHQQRRRSSSRSSASPIEHLVSRLFAPCMTNANLTPTRPVLVTGATGKVGSRVLARLERLGVAARAGSRTAAPPFDWAEPDTWPAVLDQ